MLPAGSSERSVVPVSALPSAWKYHHGSPLIAGSTTVSEPTSGAMRGSIAAIACALSPITTRSCAPKSAGSALAARRYTPPARTDVIDELQAVATDRVEVRAARDECDLVAR